jgi:hypothetical protein
MTLFFRECGFDSGESGKDKGKQGATSGGISTVSDGPGNPGPNLRISISRFRSADLVALRTP